FHNSPTVLPPIVDHLQQIDHVDDEISANRRDVSRAWMFGKRTLSRIVDDRKQIASIDLTIAGDVAWRLMWAGNHCHPRLGLLIMKSGSNDGASIGTDSVGFSDICVPAAQIQAELVQVIQDIDTANRV